MKTSLFFDLDGTIVESSKGIYGAIAYALEKMGREPLNEDQLRKFIGPPLADSFRNLGFSDSEVKLATELYRETYGVKGVHEVTVYDGIPEALSGLKQRFDLYIATSKPEHLAKQILANIDLAKEFKGIYGADTHGARVAKKDVLAYALKESGVHASQAVMIGDREHDMNGAAFNNVFALGVLWGFGSREELLESGAQALVIEPLQLIDYFSENA